MAVAGAPKGWMIDHDFAVMERAFGEVAFFGRLVLYRSDDVGYLCGWPLGREPTLPSQVELRRAIEGAFLIGCRQLHVWSPIVVELPLESGVVLWYVRPRENYDCVMRIDLQRYETELVQRGRNYRRAVRTEFEISQVSGFPGVETIGPLFARYASSSEVTAPQQKLLSLAMDRSCYDSTTCLVAHDGGNIVGVEVGRHLSEDTMIGRWAFFREGVRGVSDRLHLELINLCTRSGLRYLDLGYGVRPSLFSYKLAWGVNNILGPVYRFGLALR